MDARKHLIFVKGENLTEEILYCKYDSLTDQYEITYNGEKKYTYNSKNIVWMKSPEVLNPHQHLLMYQGKMLKKIEHIFSFLGDEEWWYIVYNNNNKLTCRKKELQIQEACLLDADSENVFKYIREMASFNELKNDEGERLLEKQYRKLEYINKESVLAIYLNPRKNKINTFNKSDVIIYPFGGNKSQFKAVENALLNQISVIQGPPGTGKTQTILNIIANLLLQNKTIQVVSNNDSAVTNIMDKLADPQCMLDFLVAHLGSKEKKQKFLHEQLEEYPNIKEWYIDSERLGELRGEIINTVEKLKYYYEIEEKIASLKNELLKLNVETEHYRRYCKEYGLQWPKKKMKKVIKSDEIVKTIFSLEKPHKYQKAIRIWYKIKNVLVWGLYEWKYNKQSIDSIIIYLQYLFYQIKKDELETEIYRLVNDIEKADVKYWKQRLTEDSFNYLKGVLYNRISKKDERCYFSDDSMWKNSNGFLKEYPIVLSTTFSSYSCLKGVLYDYVIMDEASQVDISTGALALASARNAVIVGDLKQLPNIVPDIMRKQMAEVFKGYKIDAAYSYAENSFLKSVCRLISDIPSVLLREHYRCHPKIIEFCNKKFYDNQLLIMTEDHDLAPIALYRTTPGNHAKDHLNQRQVDVILKETIPDIENTDMCDVGIIAPYKNQVKLLKSIVNPKIEVDTIHKFQGREKGTIILSTVDNVVNDFSDDPYLLNVAISRAVNKFCVVLSGNEQPFNSNMQDLVKYIEYNSFQITNSKIYSVFDLLYQQYTEQRIAYLEKCNKISEFNSENIMYYELLKLLAEFEEVPLKVSCFQKLSLLVRDLNLFSDIEVKYIKNPNTHVDFLIYNDIRKEPVLAIEVDGYKYHKEGTIQFERDRKKDFIFEKCGIPLLRVATNGSQEIESIRNKLRHEISDSGII